jgi:acetyl-CoA C-acetyltransferase
MSGERHLPVAVVGAGMIDFGELFHMSYEDMCVAAYERCLASIDKDFAESEIEAAWIGTQLGEFFRRSVATGALLSDPLRLFPRPVTRVENACCTGAEAIRNAAFSIAAGIYDVVLVVGAEKMRDIPSRQSIVAQTGSVFHEWWHPRGATAPNRFGQFATAHMDQFDTKREQFAAVAVKNHHQGTLNEHAHFRFDVTVDQVVNSPEISWPLTLLDACPTTDGAAALILTHEKFAKRYTDRPIYLHGAGLSTDPLISSWKSSYVGFPATTRAAGEAFAMAGVSPGDIDLAELHDCFSIVELMTYEDIGFCEKGKGGQFIDEGGPYPGGTVACNTSGGLKAKGHPIGATGVAQVVELWEQFRGEAGARQIDNPQLGLTHNLGGIGTVVAVNIFGAEPRKAGR